MFKPFYPNALKKIKIITITRKRVHTLKKKFMEKEFIFFGEYIVNNTFFKAEIIFKLNKNLQTLTTIVWPYNEIKSAMRPILFTRSD